MKIKFEVEVEVDPVSEAVTINEAKATELLTTTIYEIIDDELGSQIRSAGLLFDSLIVTPTV